MKQDRSTEVSATRDGLDRASQTAARNVLRAWMRDQESDALSRIGAAAIRASADAMIHLERLLPVSSTGQTLGELELLVAETIASSVTSSRRRSPGPATSQGASPQVVASLVERLDRLRDEGMRRMVALTSARARLDRVELDLGQAMSLIRALHPTIEAAVRELRGENPAQAATVRNRGAALLDDRGQAVLMQLAVHRQAMTTLDLLTSNQTALDAAVDEARLVTLSALHVSSAARRAVADAASLDAGVPTRRMSVDVAFSRVRAAFRAMTSRR